jgi:nucleoid DNA-binding protein
MMSIKTYTKRDIVEKTAKSLNVSLRSIEKIVDEVFKSMTDILTEDRLNTRIEIRNFGVLEVKPQKAKPQARNPRTNEVVYVPPRRKVHFKPGVILKKYLNKPLDQLK